MTEPLAVRLDEHGAASLDGTWEFWPRDSMEGEPRAIRVPGLWEAQGWLDVDGYAWYRRRFTLEETAGWWSLCFGAVMDVSEVHLNGVPLGGHDNPFTPFEVDPTGVLRVGDNSLTVRVFDPPVDHPEHRRLAHGKQGWANHVFPSRPSLYMTYGGIWQSVVLRRHGPVVVTEAFVNSDPDDLWVRVGLRNVSARPASVRVGVRAVGRVHDEVVAVAPGSTETVIAAIGPTDGARWSPSAPVLHDLLVDVLADGALSDRRVERFGLRSLRIEGTRLLLNGEPYRMKSALVQGIRAEELYAEGDRAAIEEEVRSARAMGLNTLRLHVKAFDPTYLDVCDEVGMLVHCDIPVAEPVDHEGMGAEGESAVATRSVQAVRQQVSRDRNHPSIIMWSVMNELCLGRPEARASDGYERFARALVAAARQADPTRPIIENDWVEPDPDRVFAADVLTAHCYGRLHADDLDEIDRSCLTWAGIDRPLYVTEFGDWGLPRMPNLPEPPFWDTRRIYAAGLIGARWPSSLARFVIGTQRYQGLSDRLQAEVFRRHDHVGGYCVTELTDVPHELNGLLDLHREPKPAAVAEMTRANQTVLPMLRLPSLVVVAGESVTAPLHVANDGPALAAVCIEVGFADLGAPLGMHELVALDASDRRAGAAAARFGASATAVRVDQLAGYRPAEVGVVTVAAPRVAGSHDLVLRLRAGDRTVAENRYPVHVVAPPAASVPVQVLGEPGALIDALGRVSAPVGSSGPTVVADGSLDAAVGRIVRERLAAGQVVVVLAQAAAAAPHFPVPVELSGVGTAWGPSVFHFTADHGALASLPRGDVLVSEDSTVRAHSLFTAVDGEPFPDTPVLIAYKPAPGTMTGTVVGSHQVGPGRLVLCQYRLCDRAAEGDAAARAILADLLRWAGQEQARLMAEEGRLADGRRVARYSHAWTLAR